MLNPAVAPRAGARGFTLPELLTVVVGTMAVVAMVVGLYGGARLGEGRFPAVAIGLIDIASAIRQYGRAHMWYWGRGHATASGSPAASADIAARQGALNFCGLMLSPPMAENVDANSGPRTRKITGIFMINKQSLIDGGFIPAGITADWPGDFSWGHDPGDDPADTTPPPTDPPDTTQTVATGIEGIEYWPGGELTDAQQLKLRYQGHVKETDPTLLTDAANATEIEEFRNLCSKPPEDDLIVIKLRARTFDRLENLRNFLESTFKDPEECQRLTIVNELDAENLVLSIQIRPNTAAGLNC